MLELVAHRGYPARFPENSLAGMRAALDAGARYVEFDVQFSRDAVPVVLHDASLRRVTGRGGHVFTLDFEAIAALPAGEPSRFGDRHADERLPRLDDMLKLIGRYPGVTAFVEIKRASLWKIGRERVMRVLEPVLQPHGERVVVLSFDRRLVAMAKDRFRTGWVFEPWKAHLRHKAEKLAPEFLFTSLRGLPPGREAFWEGPWRWAVYDVPDLAEVRLLASLGAHLVETDFIGEWLPQLQGRTA